MLLAIGALVAAARADAPRRAPIAPTLRAPRRVLMHRKHPEKRAACEPGSCTCKACCAANMTAHACRACVVAEGCVKLDDAPSRVGRPSDPDPAARPRACWPADGSAFDGGEAYWLNIADVEAERFNQPQFIHIAKTGGSAMRRCVPKARRPSGGSKARPADVCSSDWHVPLRAYDASWRARTMADWPTFCVVRRRGRVFRVDLFFGNRRSPAGTPTSGSCRSSATRSTTCGAALPSGTARGRRLLSFFPPRRHPTCFPRLLLHGRRAPGRGPRLRAGAHAQRDGARGLARARRRFVRASAAHPRRAGPTGSSRSWSS